MKTYALVTDAWGGHGGISVHNRDLLVALMSSGPQASVIAVPRVIVRDFESIPDGLTYRCAATSSTTRYLFTVLRDLLRVRRSDMIFCGHVNLAPVALVLSWFTRRPVLCALHGIEAWSRPKRMLTARAVQKMHHYYAVSNFTRDRFLEWSGVQPKSIDLLPNAIHLDAYFSSIKNHGLDEKYGVRNSYPVLLTLGRLVSRERAKGFDEMLNILPKLLKRFPQLKYIIAGDGEDRARLENRVASEGLTNVVVFTGFVDETEKAGLYRSANLYVMPSRGEGFGIVLLEALACGLPVIASSVDGSRDAVRNGELGRMVDPDDAVALESAIVDTLSEGRHGKVPDGLAYFGFDRFVERVHEIARRTITG